MGCNKSGLINVFSFYTKFSPELGGMQNLMEGLSNALLNHGPVKVFADAYDEAEIYD